MQCVSTKIQFKYPNKKTISFIRYCFLSYFYNHYPLSDIVKCFDFIDIGYRIRYFTFFLVC